MAGQLVVVGRVEAVAQKLEGHADHLAVVVEHRHAALEVGAVEHAPGGLEVRHLAAEIAQAGDRDRVGHAVVHGLVERQFHVVRIDVHAVGDQVQVQLLEHALVVHDLDHVAAGKQQVVARRAGLELGVHFLVGGVGVDDDLAVVLALELRDQLGLDVVRPGVDVQHGFLLRAAGQGRDRRGQRQRRPDSLRHGPFLLGVFFHRFRPPCGRGWKDTGWRPRTGR